MCTLRLRRAMLPIGRTRLDLENACSFNSAGDCCGAMRGHGINEVDFPGDPRSLDLVAFPHETVKDPNPSLLQHRNGGSARGDADAKARFQKELFNKVWFDGSIDFCAGSSQSCPIAHEATAISFSGARQNLHGTAAKSLSGRLSEASSRPIGCNMLYEVAARSIEA